MEGRLSRRLFIESIRHLWPRKQVVRGCLLPATCLEPDRLVERCLEYCSGDPVVAETLLNTQFLPDLLLAMPDMRTTSKEEFQLIAETYVALLEAEIRRVSPEIPYEIIVTGDFDKIPEIEEPNGRRTRIVEALDVKITCCRRVPGHEGKGP